MTRIEMTKAEARILRVLCELALHLEANNILKKGAWDSISHTAFQEEDNHYD